MRLRNGWLITNAALLTYVIPASFLAIPFYLIMNHYGLHDNPWSVSGSQCDGLAGWSWPAPPDA